MRQPSDVSKIDNSVVRDAFRFFCRHLVCLGGTLQDLDDNGGDKGEIRSFACSAFVLVIRNRWFLLTAGHCIKDLDNGLRQRKFRLIDSYVMAGFGPEVKAHGVAKEPIYFGYEETRRGYIDQDGLDFGLLDLGNYLRLHLEVNEVEPVREENWRVFLGEDFDWHVIVGFPEEYVALGQLSPTMVYVHKLQALPEGIKVTEWRRFAGKLGEGLPLKSMRGMSGGPIYGFKRNQPNKYWIVAIQTEWHERLKITFGCPVPLLAQLAETCMFGDTPDDAAR